ncbi:NAD(P)-binding protein [Pleurotus eryngii]|uniref:NAD(P)-binding protein n=1 Tax=Pleurotus eryngii TaxID=5323 RepID=A0A9P6ABT4_PLEER|nr:NAD(P)-binding protein [Pleurotus eryngii]
MTSNARITLAKLPEGSNGLQGLPTPGEHLILDQTRTIDLDNVPLNGGFLTKTIFLSPEPALRERMRDSSIQSYTTSFIVGAPVIGFGLVVVLRSEKKGIKAGDYMYGQTTPIDFKPEDWPPATFDMDSLALQVVPNPGGAFPVTHYASALGTPGLSAFVGFEGLAQAKEGQTIFVSAGGSGVGNMVVQLAKQKGMKVIASAGSSAKCDYVRSLGADVLFNYKEDGYDVLKQYKPIHLYWDNVGGEALEAAIEHLEPFSRVVCCGSLSDYNKAPSERYGIKNTTLIFKKRLTLTGFIVPDLIPQYGRRFFTEIPALLAQGKIKSREVVFEGIDNAPRALLAVLNGGEDAGKVVVMVAKE